ncbi:MAG TPA: hypothetical protein VGW40_05795 [Allosphingosinicella sp.]|nr:hypothetical protein [Allosphingosinicella sp.]
MIDNLPEGYDELPADALLDHEAAGRRGAAAPFSRHDQTRSTGQHALMPPRPQAPAPTAQPVRGSHAPVAVDVPYPEVDPNGRPTHFTFDDQLPRAPADHIPDAQMNEVYAYMRNHRPGTLSPAEFEAEFARITGRGLEPGNAAAVANYYNQTGKWDVGVYYRPPDISDARGDHTDPNRRAVNDMVMNSNPGTMIIHQGARMIWGDEGADAFERQAQDAAMFGFRNEVGAGIQSLVGGGNYSSNLAREDAIDDYDTDHHYSASLAGQIAGTLPYVFIPGIGEARGATMGTRALNGAIQGGLYGAGTSRGGAGDRLLGGAGGALFGSTLNMGGGALADRWAARGAARAEAGREVLNAADNLNTNLGTDIAPLPAHVGGGAVRRVQGGSEATILGGAQLDRAHGRFAGQLDDATTRIAGGNDSIGEAADAISNRANPDSFANLPDRIEARNSRLYREAGDLAGDARLTTPETIRTLDAEIARLNQVPGGVAGLDRLTSLRQALAAGDHSVDGLRRLRTSFGDSLEAGDRTVREAANRLWGPLSQDITTGLERQGLADAARAYRRADIAYRNGLGHADIVSAIVGNNSGERIADRLVNMSRNDGAGLHRALRLMAPEEAQSVRAGIINHLGQATNGRQNAAGDAFSLETFLTNWNRMSERTKGAAFSGQVRQDLNDLARLAQAAREGGTFRNLSRTGNTLNVVRMIVEFGAHFGTGGATLAHHAMGAGASAMIGRFLSAPGAARLMVNASERGLTASQFTRRLNGLVVRLGSGEAGQAVAAFRDWYVGGGPNLAQQPAQEGALDPVEPMDLPLDDPAAGGFEALPDNAQLDPPRR